MCIRQINFVAWSSGSLFLCYYFLLHFHLSVQLFLTDRWALAEVCLKQMKFTAVAQRNVLGFFVCLFEKIFVNGIRSCFVSLLELKSSV